MTDLFLQIGLSNACFSLALAIVSMVVFSLKPKTQTYANSLLTAIECLACPALRSPAIASEINSGGFLERRFKMIVSNNPNRSSSRWLRVCVLLCAVLVLPFGVAIAQDYDAVGRRLRAAVQAGELTAEQARAMLGTLRKAGDAGKDQSSDRAKAYLMNVRKDLGAAVKAGKISREDAVERYKAAEKGIRERMAAGRRRDDSKRISREDWGGIRKRIEGAVERGDMTREEADAKYREIKKRMGQKNNRNEVDWDAIKRRVEGAVERGDMTREEADAKYREIKKRMGQKNNRNEVDWDAIKRRVEGAVERGDMTREEADAKYREIRERMARSDRGDGLRARYAAVAEKIRAAVEAGEITEEQGKARLEGLKKRLAQEAKGERTRGDRR